ncbi:MAG: hypothetical protein WC389_07975 [Lutibacter sp.]|jgi:septal ring factor EnvC (AmiA/AmiB activator)
MDVPGRVIQIDPSDMSTVATWTGASGENEVKSVIFDGTYIYAGLYTGPGKVVKIDPSDMSTVTV